MMPVTKDPSGRRIVQLELKYLYGATASAAVTRGEPYWQGWLQGALEAREHQRR